jgi:hypothetical protein
MQKGKSTMLGRIMAGSQAVIAHNEAARALFVAYHPPDIPLSQVIVEYCQKVALVSGTFLFVIDRAVNAVGMACAFAKQGLGLRCRLDDNEPDGLQSFEATQAGTLEEGTKVYNGAWQVPRPDDPRHCVLVEPLEGKTWVYWGTPKMQATLEATEWPRVYRERNAIQENSFKRMIDHGALNTNEGRKKIVGPDRHQQRARDKLVQLLEAAQKRVDQKTKAVKAQQEKGTESVSKGHGTRLAQRQGTLVELDKEHQDAQRKHGSLAAQGAALGPPGARADRDFRKQTIMTFRTLLLENALSAFMVVRLGTLQTKGSLERVLHLLFERSGARLETATQGVYWVNTTGLSVPYRHLLAEVVGGLDTMDMREQGKPIRVRLRDMPP